LLMTTYFRPNYHCQPDYRKIAEMFGNGATYHSIEGRFREYRSIAANMRANASPDGRKFGNPATPRSGKSSAVKSASKKRPGKDMSDFDTPSKKGKVKYERVPEEIIVLDDDEDGAFPKTKFEVPDPINSFFKDDFATVTSALGLEPSIFDMFGVKKESRFVDSQSNGYVEPRAETVSPDSGDEAPRDTGNGFRPYTDCLGAYAGVTEYEDMA
jgi:hypothetical protein